MFVSHNAASPVLLPAVVRGDLGAFRTGEVIVKQSRRTPQTYENLPYHNFYKDESRLSCYFITL